MPLVRSLRGLQVSLGLVRRQRMEVTRHNFDTLLPEVLEAIDKAEFVAIDGEFTGLLHDRSKSNAHFDTPSERYVKVRDSCQRFLLVQFGLCAFHYDQQSKRFSNKAYNFYVWPRPHSRNAPDPCFMVQPSSIDFLCQQAFDFNKLFNDGIGYLRPHEEAKLRASLDEERQRRQLRSNETNSDIAIPEDQQALLDDIVKRVETLIGQKKDEKHESNGGSKDRTLELGSMNGFQRRLVYQTLGNKFGSQLIVETCDDKRSMRVKFNEDESNVTNTPERREQSRYESNLATLDKAFGFSKVIKRLCSQRKVIVGHNMLLDLGHTLDQFITPLPPEYEEFKELVKCNFGSVIDTKLMASSFPFKEDMLVGTSLSELYNRLTEKPFEMPSMHTSGYFEGDKERYHEAGYDAYVTGMCFIAMCQRLNSIAKKKNKRNASDDVDKVINMKLLSPFLNKIFLMRIPDIPYMNLDGADLSPSRSHVFHVSFPSSWRSSDLVLLFAPLGQVFISWIDDTSAFVSLASKDNAVQITRLVVPQTVTIISYDQFKALDNQSLSSNMKSSSIPLSLSSSLQSSTTGITPSLEKSTISFGLDTSKKKRVAEDEEMSDGEKLGREMKRTKSVIEEQNNLKTRDNGTKADEDKGASAIIPSSPSINQVMDWLPGMNLLRQARDATRLAFAIKEHRRQQQRQQQLVQRERNKNEVVVKDEKAVAKVRETFEQGHYRDFCSLYFGDFLVQKVMDLKELFFNIWDLYWILLLLRLVLVLWPQPGYFHPDEFMQSLEVVSGDVFGWKTTRTWEWNSDQPIRTAVIPLVFYGMPLWLLKVLNDSFIIVLSPYMLITLPRLVMFVLSLSVDTVVYKICKLYQHNFNVCLVTLASSHLMLTMATRCLSNCFEMVLFAWLLYLVCYSLRVTHETLFLHDLIDASHSQASSIRERVLISRKRKLIPKHEFRHFCTIALIAVVGLFNRFTFVAFAAIPIFFWLIRGVEVRSKRFEGSLHIFNLRMLSLIPCFVMLSLTFVLVDSLYFGGLTMSKLYEMEFEWADFKVTPINFLLYNVKKENVAQHGIHPRYLHATLNLALLFGPLSLCLVYTVWSYFRSMLSSPWHLKPSLRSAQTVLIFSILSPLAMLSLIPHQEPRFLLPLITPVILLTSHLLRKRLMGRRVLLGAWYVFNVTFSLFYGFAHQGGVMASLKFVSNNVEADSKVFFCGTYMPYSFLNMDKSIVTVDLGSSIEVEALSAILNGNLMPKDDEEKNKTSKVYVVAPMSIVSELKSYSAGGDLRISTIFNAWPHVSVETLPHTLHQWWQHMHMAHAQVDLSLDQVLHLFRDGVKLVNDFSLVTSEVSHVAPKAL